MESTITSKLSTSASELIKGDPFLTFDYWFGTPNPLGLGSKLVAFELLSTLLIILTLILIAYKYMNAKLTPPQDKFLNKVILWTLAFGPLGWLLVLSRTWGVVFFSARFLWLIWFIALAIIVFLLVRFYRQKLPFAQKQYQTYQIKRRYFPKKKAR